jgi:hypothetical protein
LEDWRWQKCVTGCGVGDHRRNEDIREVGITDINTIKTFVRRFGNNP